MLMRMRWVTYRDDDGERTGILADDVIHPMPPGVTLLDLIALGLPDYTRRARTRCARRTPCQWTG